MFSLLISQIITCNLQRIISMRGSWGRKTPASCPTTSFTATDTRRLGSPPSTGSCRASDGRTRLCFQDWANWTKMVRPPSIIKLVKQSCHLQSNWTWCTAPTAGWLTCRRRTSGRLEWRGRWRWPTSRGPAITYTQTSQTTSTTASANCYRVTTPRIYNKILLQQTFVLFDPQSMISLVLPNYYWKQQKSGVIFKDGPGKKNNYSQIGFIFPSSVRLRMRCCPLLFPVSVSVSVESSPRVWGESVTRWEQDQHSDLLVDISPAVVLSFSPCDNLTNPPARSSVTI